MRIKSIHPHVHVPEEVSVPNKIVFKPMGDGTYEADVPDKVGEFLINFGQGQLHPEWFEKIGDLDVPEASASEASEEATEQLEEELVDEPEGAPPPGARRGRRGGSRV